MVVVGYPRLWFAEREVPLTPLFEFLEDPPSFVHKLLWLGFIVSALSVVVQPFCKLGFIVLIVFWLSSISLDLLRLQPFFYYSFICLAVVFYDKNKAGESFASNTLRALTFGLYFWPGITKFNYGFYNDMLPWLMEPYILLDTALKKNIAGTLAASIEVLAAFFLFLPRFRKAGVFLVVAIHLGILTIYGPLGRSHHMAVLPWSIAQLILVPLVFWNQSFRVRDVVKPKTWVGAGGRGLVLLIPILSFWDMWPTLFSFRLYSASALHSNIIVNERFINESGLDLRKWWNEKNGGLPIMSWTLEDTGSFYVSAYYYRNLFWQICRTQKMKNPQLIINYSLKYEPFFLANQKIDRIYNCEDFVGRGKFRE